MPTLGWSLFSYSLGNSPIFSFLQTSQKIVITRQMTQKKNNRWCHAKKSQRKKTRNKNRSRCGHERLLALRLKLRLTSKNVFLAAIGLLEIFYKMMSLFLQEEVHSHTLPIPLLSLNWEGGRVIIKLKRLSGYRAEKIQNTSPNEVHQPKLKHEVQT